MVFINDLLLFKFAFLAPLDTNAHMSEFNGADIQGNTGMMQQGSPMVFGGVNPPVSGLISLIYPLEFYRC